MHPLQPIEPSFLENLVAQGNRVLEQPAEVQLSLAQDPLTPRSLLEVLVSRADAAVADVARLHVNWAGELADWHAEIDAVFQTAQLGQNDRLAVELLKLGPVPPEFLSEWVPANVLIQALKNPHMPLRYRLKLLERLAQEPTLDPRLEVAESPETPLTVLEQLVGDLELPVRLATKYNPTCPPALVQLVEGQQLIACDWSTDAEQLTNLGRSRWDWIRLAVAQNPSASITTLEQLATDAAFKIQLAVAKNPSTSESILAQLASHPENAIQMAVAQNFNATESILLQMLPIQRSLILQRPNLPAGVLQQLFDEAALAQDQTKAIRDLYYLFFRQPHTPETVLAALSEWDVDAIRAYLQVKNQPARTLEVMESWVNDYMDYLAEVARHPNVSITILERLAPCPNPKVRLAVAQNPITPNELKGQLLEELSTHSEQSIQAQVASNINTPIPILEAMAEREIYQPKLLREIQRVIASEYPPNPSSYKSLADQMMSFVKHQILTSAGLTVDVERWMEVVESPDLLAAMAASAKSGDLNSALWRDRLAFRFADLLPELEEESLKRLSQEFCSILGMANYTIKNDASVRAVPIALVGNPNTPAARREQLKNQLIRPFKSLDDYDNDCLLLLSIACNNQVREDERKACFNQLINAHHGKFLLAANPLTPIDLLEQLAEQGLQGTWELVEKIARNPTTPDFLIRRLVNDRRADYVWRLVAEYANAPVDVLLKILYEEPEGKVDSNVSTIDYVLKNPNLPILERYRFLLSQEESQETARTNELLARRPDSPYALAQVLEKGDRNAKIAAARSPRTPIAVLEQLARDTDETVRSVMIDNQNLPLSLRLVMTNDTSVNIRCGLARKHTYRDTQIEVLEKLANDESEKVRALVAANSCTPIEILIRLGNDARVEVKQSLVSNPNTPTNILNRLGLEEDIFNVRNPNTPGIVLAHAVSAIKKRQSYDYMAKNALSDFLKHPVKDSQMLAETLAELANHSDPSVRYRVAQHPNTPTSALEHLANDDYVPTIRAVVDNPNTPPQILEQLALSPDVSTRLSVVRNPNTPSRVLAEIIQSSVTSGNAPNRTVDTLKSAFPGDQNDVLREIACKPQAPLEALEILARREFITPPIDPNSILPPRSSDDILRSLAYNPSLTPALLGILTQDPCVDVRVALLRHPNLTLELWHRLTEDNAVSVRSVIAASPQAPARVLVSLTADAEAEVRQKLASNPNTSETSLHQLAQDSDLTVRSAIAINPSTPIPLLEQLAQDDKVEVRRAVVQNPNTPASIREVLRDLVPPSRTSSASSTLRSLSRLYNPNTDDLATVLAEYAQSDNAFVRLVTLLHPLTPVAVLEQGGRSQSWLERYAAAENFATPEPMRQQLAQDGNRIVRTVAQSSL